MSKKRRDVKISYWAAHFTTIVSVTMLLVLIGAICLLGMSARNTAKEVKQQQEVSLVMTDSVSNAQADSLMRVLQSRPFVNAASLITKEQALADWDESTGDKVEEIAGYNFFTPEITLSLKSEYTVPDSIAKVEKELKEKTGVEEVVMPDSEVIDSMDSFFSRTMLILSIVAVAMIAISFVLINNTVLLTIYSRRFTIHTMQLVGARPGFIRRPFVLGNLGAGILAGLLAGSILAGFIGFVRETQMPELAHYLSTVETASVCISLAIAGGLLCAMSAFTATNRYLHKDYDELFI
ncbi:MAG: permease-like cell division protein FtsX [Prevotella sp.]|nr:permease-like cell division protein FtsX [Prevotella sp.]MCM1074506.1 permease-like cell division protein FtsX [Ruminococcus sp.]